MNANVALLEPQAEPAPCAEELTRINESLRARERLLIASAKASRQLLEAPDVRAAIPGVLGLLGEAAHVDRVNLMQTRTGPNGEPLLVVVSEWTAEGVTPSLQDSAPSCDERNFSGVCAELRAGRSVCFSKSEVSAGNAVSVIEGIGTQTKAIVPIFVAGEFMGVVGFDNTRQHRAIDSSELATLETAAGVIGAALYRERLVDDVRRERQHAAEERVAELAKANAVIRGNLERLAGETDLHSFMGHMLLEATRQFDAMSGAVIVLKDSLQEWRIVAHVRDGQLADPPYATSVPVAGSPFTARFADLREPLYLQLAANQDETWPGALEYQRNAGAVGTVVYPLVFGARSVGFLVMSFQREAHDVQRSELLVALAQQATLAVQLTRLAYSAKEAAVLMERTRIGQEIHDGLAQAFTGILLQLGAVEEFPSCRKRGSVLTITHSRIRELARDGLAEARRSVMALRLDQTRRAGGGEQRGAPRPPADGAHHDDGRTHALDAGRGGRRRRNATEPGAAGPAGIWTGEHAPARRCHRRTVADRQRGGPRHARQCAYAEKSVLVAAVMKTHIRVVLADDHPVVRDGLVAMVNQQADMEVVGEAGDGEEAIALYEQHRPDVMVLDLRMPKRDGVSVVQRVLEINPKACILIMTTYDGDEDIFQCLSQGAKGYLLKDAPRQEILSAIRAVSEDRPYTSSAVAAKALQRMAKPSLTQRELDVLQLVAQGRSNKDIARRLSITEGTAKTHVKAILTKLDAISRTEAVAVAHKRGLIRL
jgi:two-component system NarL family response regulator